MSHWCVPEEMKAHAPQPVLFLDRDGVVIGDKDYLKDPAGVELLPGVAEAMVRARDAGYLLVGVSNQSGLGRGYFTTDDFDAVMTRIAGDLAAFGARFDAFFYCPHAPGQDCVCRKPSTGMLTEAAVFFEWDSARSWVIGDKTSDVGLGQNAGLGSILVRTGYGAAQEAKVRKLWPDAPRVHVADDLAAALDMILETGTKINGAVAP